jgi:hypothetical protein
MPENCTIHIHLISVDRNNSTYSSNINGQTEFQFTQVLEGKYKLMGYIDLDMDGKFSAGNLYPFKYSEPYYVSNDTLRVRKRWEISDVKFSIPGLEE